MQLINLTRKRFLRTFFISLLVIGLSCTFIFYQMLWHYGTEVFRLDSPTLCNIPLIDPHSKSAKILIEINGRFDGAPPCIGLDNRFKINYNSSSLLRLKSNDSFWDSVKCCYKLFNRLSDDTLIFGSDCFPIEAEETHLPFNHQNLDIRCNDKISNTQVYRDQLPFFRPDPQIETQVDEIASKIPLDRFSVLILGLDSVSHQNFVRYMPKTYHYLMDDLSAIEYFGFNKVGSGTIANVMAMVSGCKVLNPLDPPFIVEDHCELIWTHYADAGYRTVHVEDSGFNEFGLYPTIRKNRKGIGTHYNLSDFMFGVRDIDKNEYEETFEEGFGCWQNQFVMEVLSDPIIEVATKFSNKPYFNFVWFGKTGHAVMSNTKYMDEPIYKILTTLKSRDLLNNTIVFVIADHGPWHGAYLATNAGALERLMPTMFVYLPPKFKHSYAESYENLKLNSKRLTTQYDFHATLMDFLNLRQDNMQHYASKLGQSLLTPVPLGRGCDSANIPAEYCMCWTRYSVSNPQDADHIKAAVTIALIHLNSELQDFPMCAPLSLKNIISATRLGSRYNDVKADDELLEITFDTHPAGAEFQATLRFKGQIEIIGQVLRTNVYKGQSDCIGTWSNATYAKTMCLCI